MAVSNTNMSTWQPFVGIIPSAWGNEVCETIDDKLHMTETSNTQTIQGPINFSYGSLTTWAGPVQFTDKIRLYSATHAYIEATTNYMTFYQGNTGVINTYYVSHDTDANFLRWHWSGHHVSLFITDQVHPASAMDGGLFVFDNGANQFFWWVYSGGDLIMSAAATGGASGNVSINAGFTDSAYVRIHGIFQVSKQTSGGNNLMYLVGG